MNPQLLHIYGPFWITSYGLFMALGLLAFFGAAFFHAGRRHYISDEQFFDAAASGIVGGLLGGKILYLAQHAGFSFVSFHDFLNSLLGGFAILGAIIGALVSVVAYLYWQELPIREVLDLAGAYALLAHGIARWGCYFAGCCYGAISATPWLSVIYTDAASLAPLHLPLYPTQMMMSIASLAGFFLLRFVIYPWRGRPLGTVVAWYILYESTSRFIIDFWRGDRPLSVGTSALSFYQYAAIMVILGSLASIIILHRCKRR